MAQTTWILTNTSVRVHYNIPWDLAQIEPGGATYEAARDSARGALHYVKAEILANHTRSGWLAQSLRTDVSKRGTKVVRGVVRSNVEHAKWFFYGTAEKGTGRIYPTGGRGLKLHDADGPIQAQRLNEYGQPDGDFGPIIVGSVQGQRSHENIIREGAAVGLARVAGGFGVKTGVKIRR